MSGRIEWSKTKYGEVGRVGGIRLFEISWGTTHGDDRPWKLQSTLPVRFTYPGGATVDDAKAHAEKILTAFVGRLGATFPDSPTTDQKPKENP